MSYSRLTVFTEKDVGKKPNVEIEISFWADPLDLNNFTWYMMLFLDDVELYSWSRHRCHLHTFISDVGQAAVSDGLARLNPAKYLHLVCEIDFYNNVVLDYVRNEPSIKCFYSYFNGSNKAVQKLNKYIYNRICLLPSGEPIRWKKILIPDMSTHCLVLPENE